MTNYLAKKAILVTLNISHWSARKFDKRVTDGVLAEYNAAADVGRWNKLIMPKAAVDAVTKIVNAARSYHLEHTLPWRGDTRLLSVRLYEDYAKEMSGFEADFWAAKLVFVKNYERLRDNRRVEMGGLFNEKDYPTVSQLENKFGWKLTPEAFADASDLRIELAGAHAEQIRAEIEKNVNEAHDAALKAPLHRVADAVGRMVERLTAYAPADNGVRAKGTFKDSLVENVMELADLLPAMNLAENPEFDKLAADLKTKLCAEDPQTLRDNELVREAVAADASAILARVESLLA